MALLYSNETRQCGKCQAILQVSSFTRSHTRCDECATPSAQTCTKCHMRYKMSEFYDDTGRPSGKHPWCKNCIKTKNAAYASSRKRVVNHTSIGRRYSLLKYRLGPVVTKGEYAIMLISGCATCGADVMSQSGVSVIMDNSGLAAACKKCCAIFHATGQV
jgi:predicted nucleic acid-binding Zn ribbon protein